MPGSITGEQSKKLVADLMERRDYFEKALAPRFREMVTDHRLYLGHREDRRLPHEKWRSMSWLGDPARLTDTEVQAQAEILTSMDPPITVEGVDPGDEARARAYERAGDYWLRQQKWTYTLEMVLRGLSIQGWKVLKTGFREIRHQQIKRPTKAQLIQFDTQLNEALKTGLVSNPPGPSIADQGPEAMGQWQDWHEANSAVYPMLPALPMPGPVDTIEYRGPYLFRPSEFSLLFDPYIENWSEQPLVMQRIVKPRKWGEEQVKAGKFDEKAFAEGKNTDEGKRLTQYEVEIAAQYGLTCNEQDPFYKEADEYYECWRIGDADPYLVILNRKTAVNVSTANPFWHQRLPYIAVRNVPLEGRAFGLSSYNQLRKSFHDRLTFRDLLFDGLILSVLPVFLKSRNLGLSEAQRFLQPGAILEVNDPNGLKPGWTSMAGFAELMRVGEMLMADQNTQLGTWENVQGQSATVGRVSATESQSRLQQALVKQKKKAERYEDELSGIWPQMFYNAYQHYSEPEFAGLMAKIVGKDEDDPFAEVTRETFAEDIAQDVRFRGAASKINKELMAQQLKDFLVTVSQIQSASGIPTQLMTPVEAREVMRRLYETLVQKGSAAVFTAEGDAAAQQLLEAHQQQAANAPLAAQNQGIQLQTQQQQMMNPQPQIDPATGQPVQQAPQEEQIAAQ
jgi:hypothetical protein